MSASSWPPPLVPPEPVPPWAPPVTPTPADGRRGGPEWRTGWLGERLFSQRLVVVSGRLDVEAATEASAQLLALEALGEEPIRLHLACEDGELPAALSMMDTLDVLGVAVHALAVGQVGGPAVGVFAVAGRRLAGPHASFRVCEPVLRLDGTARELDARADELRGLLDAFYRRLSAATGRQAAAWRDDAEAGRFLTPEQAVQYGLADDIVERAAR